MKICITGHRGFIGSYVQRLLPEAFGYDIADDSRNDILNTGHFTRFLQDREIDTIIHLAALVSIPDSQRYPQSYIANNINGTASVIQAALSAGVKKVVYASSSASYEPTSSVYAFTKYAPELLLQHYQDKLETASLRFFNVYGKGSNPAYARVIDEFIKGIKKDGNVTIFGDGEQTRDFIHVLDVAHGIKAAAILSLGKDKVLDFGSGKSVSINTLAQVVADRLGRPVKITHAPARQEVRHSRAKYSLVDLFEFTKPLISLEEGIDSLL